MSTLNEPQTGVIHNIGYRHYEGNRLGRFDITKALFGQTFRGAFGIQRGAKAKIFPWFLMACVLMPAFVIVAVETNMGSVILDMTSYTTMVQAVPALFLAVQAPQAVSRDLRFGTMSLYFSRPMRPSDYVIAKIAGVFAALMVFLAAPLILMYIGELLVDEPFWSATQNLAIAVFSVVLLALLLSCLGVLIASVTPRRGLGVAAILTVVVGSYGVATTVQSSIEFVSGSSDKAIWASVLSPITLYDTAQAGLFRISTSTIGLEPGFGMGLAATAVILMMSAACFWLLNVRYRKVASA